MGLKIDGVLEEFLANHLSSSQENVFEASISLATNFSSCWTTHFINAALGLRGGVGHCRSANVVLMELDGQLHLHAYSF